MKRVSHLFEKLIADENLELAIDTVNKTHRYYKHHKPNKTVLWVEKHKKETIQKLKNILINGYIAPKIRGKQRYDKSSEKWRFIYEPNIYPEQYIHHAVIQVLEPIFMRGMDHYCCGSIKGRGISYGVKSIKKWMKNPSKTKYCLELDIRHFYDTIDCKVLINKLKRIIKDYRMIKLVDAIVKDGVLIGLYTSQWFANISLQDLDHKIRECGVDITRYLRYMDNFTLFSNRKRNLHKIKEIIKEWLKDKELKIKDNWQIFKTYYKNYRGRMVNALGYKYGSNFMVERKKNRNKLTAIINLCIIRFNKCLHIYSKLACSVISRYAHIKYCKCKSKLNNYELNFDWLLKKVIRRKTIKEQALWNMYLV